MSPSKWEWIAEKLEELGEIDLAAKAKEIETVLKCIYGDTRTESWLAEYNKVENRYANTHSVRDKLRILRDIVEGTYYCIACTVEAECYQCRFAKIAGFCLEPSSLFSRFYEKLVDTILDPRYK